jgi:hypothetical protein
VSNLEARELGPLFRKISEMFPKRRVLLLQSYWLETVVVAMYSTKILCVGWKLSLLPCIPPKFHTTFDRSVSIGCSSGQITSVRFSWGKREVYFLNRRHGSQSLLMRSMTHGGAFLNQTAVSSLHSSTHLDLASASL